VGSTHVDGLLLGVAGGGVIVAHAVLDVAGVVVGGERGVVERGDVVEVSGGGERGFVDRGLKGAFQTRVIRDETPVDEAREGKEGAPGANLGDDGCGEGVEDRKSTRLNSS